MRGNLVTKVTETSTAFVDMATTVFATISNSSPGEVSLSTPSVGPSTSSNPPLTLDQVNTDDTKNFTHWFIGTTAEPVEQPSELHRIGVIVGFSILIGVTTFGNFLIILAILLEPRLRSSSSSYYASLALADMMVGCLVMPPMMLYTLNNYWPYGVILCDLWVALDFLACTASFFCLCAIAGERYSAIVHPLKHMSKSTKRRKILILLGVWFGAAVAWVPSVFIIRTLSGDTEDTECDFAVNKTFIIISCCVVYYIPVVLMVTFYVLIYSTIRRHLTETVSIKRRPADVTSSAITTDATSVSQTVAETRVSQISLNVAVSVDGVSTDQKSGQEMQIRREAEEKRTRAKRHMKAARTLGLIMAVFLVCWLPWMTSWPIEGFLPGSVPNWAYQWSSWAAYINSAINPFLYVYSSLEFRVAVKKMLFCKCSN